MRSALTALLLTFGLAACEPPASEPAEEPAPGPVATSETAIAAPPATTPATVLPNVAITDLDALIGEYRVAGVDGSDIDLPHGISARISGDGILATSRCIELSWVWFFKDGRLVTEQIFPRESCGRKLLPEEEAIVAAFNGATAVGRTPSNGIEFSGENGSVLLFSQ